MPVPAPSSDESQDDFIGRCMANDDMQEYDTDQRAAICYSQWEERGAHVQGTTVMSSLSEKHRELCRQKAQIAEQMRAVIKQEDDGSVSGDDAGTHFATLEAKLADLEARITRCEAAM